jgi:hypothetical protein
MKRPGCSRTLMTSRTTCSRWIWALKEGLLASVEREVNLQHRCNRRKSKEMDKRGIANFNRNQGKSSNLKKEQPCSGKPGQKGDIILLKGKLTSSEAAKEETNIKISNNRNLLCFKKPNGIK